MTNKCNATDEVRGGFYVPGLIKRSWHSQLEILKVFDQICSQYDIKWFAMFGSMLGAVRHAGFIPRDDDLDVAMLRSEYEKFAKIVSSQLPEELAFYSLEYNAENEFVFSAGLGLKGHAVDLGVMEQYGGFPFRTVMDIFVIDDRTLDQEKETARGNEIRHAHDVYQELVRRFDGDLDQELAYAIAERALNATFPRQIRLQKQIADYILARFEMYNGSDADICGNMRYYYEWGGSPVFEKAWLKDLIRIPFEEVTIQIPRAYDKMLTCCFGPGYMTPYKGGSGHGYPVFHKEHLGIDAFYKSDWGFLYQFDANDFCHEKGKSLRSIISGVVSYLKELHGLLRAQLQDIEVSAIANIASVDQILGECQDRAVQVGTLIEQKRPEYIQLVAIMENYCEAVFAVYEAVHNSVNADAVLSWEEIARRVEHPFKRMELILDEFQAMACSNIRRRIVFMPAKSADWDAMAGVYQKAVSDPTVEAFIMPIPYCERSWAGELTQMAIDGEIIADMAGVQAIVLDCNAVNVSEVMADCIVIGRPYDDCSFTESVDPRFYSAKIKNGTDCLFYIPWFVTDDISFENPQDYPALMNMEYYVTVPGLAHCDYTLLQSETMRESYIRVLTDFAGDNTRDEWEKRLVAAGSCLFDGTDREKTDGGSERVWHILKGLMEQAYE